MNERLIWFGYSKRKFLVHKLKSAVYRLLLKRDSAKQSRGLFSTIARKTLPRVILIIIAVSLVLTLDHFFITFISSSVELKEVFSFVPSSMDLALSLGLITTGIGVAGVFLALYSANINSIYTAKYANAPESIAGLFENDIVSNKSISQISNYLLSSTVLACLCIANHHVGAITLIAFLIYTIILIISFGLLGNKRHRLSDTYGIATAPLAEIVNLIEKATSKGLFSSDVNFQAHYQKVCSIRISVLKEVAEFNISGNENRNEAMLDFCSMNNAVLTIYWQKKTEIRFSSKWYCDKAEYKKWHLANDHEVQLALRTGTSLSQENMPDYFWLEDSIFDINDLVLSELINTRDWKNIYSFCMRLSDLTESAVIGNSAKCCLNYVEKVMSKISDLLFADIDDKTRETNSFVPNIVDALCMLPTSIAISINRYLSNISWNNYIPDMLSASKYESIDLRNNPFANNRNVEQLYLGISTENLIDGKRITPDWYIEQTLACCILKNVEEVITVLDRVINISADILGDKLLERNLSVEAMVVFSRTTETKTKIRVSCEALNELLPFLEEKCLDKTGIFSVSSYKPFLDHMERISKALPAQWVKCAEIFTIEHWEDSEKYPDILGQCYNNLCEYLMNCLTDIDLESFAAIYPSFLRITIIYQEFIRRDLADRTEPYMQEAIVSAISKPIIEYSTISGYAYLWGELIDSKWKAVVTESLDKFQSKAESFEEIYTRWIALCEIHDHRYPAMYDRDLIQTEWNIRIEHTIRGKELLKYERSGPFGSEVLETNSALVRAFLGSSPDMIFFSKAHEVFLIECINPYLPIEKRYKSSMGWEKKAEDEDA